MSGVEHFGPFEVIEFRRYEVKPDQRDEFATYFEAYFLQAFEQLGSMIFGEFLERGDESRFTWIRGFRDIDARAAVNTAFYTGPVWREHSSTMNNRLIDHTDTLLLRPLDEKRAISVLPTVDPIVEPEGATGVVVAHVLKLEAAGLEAAVEIATSAFAEYVASGAREAGVLVTLDAENNFPGLPFRTDGPYLVWLGILESDDALAAVSATAERIAESLAAARHLRSAELVVLDPLPRSRLRWLQ